MPTTIYKFAVLENQEWISPVDDDDFETFLAMDGRVIRNWAPPVMRILEADEGSGKPSYSDFPWLGEHAPILKKPAVDALAPLLTQYGQLMPLEGESVWLFNVTTVLDALDKEKSHIVSFDDGDILAIERHVFKRDVIGTTEIYKLPGRASAVYTTDRFVDRVRGSSLHGVAFAPVWVTEDE